MRDHHIIQTILCVIKDVMVINIHQNKIKEMALVKDK